MRTRIRRTVGLAAAATLLGFAPGVTSSAAAASPSKPIGAAYSSTVGVPSSVRAGTTVYMHTWYMEKSPDSIAAQDFIVSVRSLSTSSEAGISVSWLNPITGRWQAVNRSGSADFGLFLETEPTHLTLAPGKWARIDFRITFGNSAHLGSWSVAPHVPNGYVMLNSHGAPVAGYLSFAPTRSFNVSVHR